MLKDLIDKNVFFPLVLILHMSVCVGSFSYSANDIKEDVMKPHIFYIN